MRWIRGRREEKSGADPLELRSLAAIRVRDAQVQCTGCPYSESIFVTELLLLQVHDKRLGRRASLAVGAARAAGPRRGRGGRHLARLFHHVARESARCMARGPALQ
jgi:hypothetical protein